MKKDIAGAKCPVCGKGTLEEANDIVSNFGGHLFVEAGHRCNKCGEEFIGEEQGDRTIAAARKLGVWGSPMKLHRKLTKTARGIILRVPADVEKSMDLKGSEEVEVSCAKDRIIIQVLKKKR